MNPLADTARFYDLLGRLDASKVQGLPLRSYGGTSGLPPRGVYFFREPGEQRSNDSNFPRVVRIGTHAVSVNSKSTLWQRLRAHLGTRTGGGNHRGSIFRLHVGAAMLARDQVDLPTWGKGSSAPPALRESQGMQALESAWEQKVSEYIGAMTVLWVNVPDEPSSESIRAVIERNVIALLSNSFAPLDSSSLGWLGRHSPRGEIRRSGLWNLNYVDQGYDPCVLDLFESAVKETLLGEVNVQPILSS